MTASARWPGSSALLLRGGRVIDPLPRFDGLADVLIEDGRVAAYGTTIPAPESARVLDCSGCVVAPGFIDLHTHLRFPGFPAKETMATGTAAAAAGGFTTVCAMANTDPVVDSVDVLSEVLAEAERAAIIRVRQLAAVSRGLRGEQLSDFAALAGAGAVAFSDDGKPVADPRIMRAALEAGARLHRAISVHEEEVSRGGVANAGMTARTLGLPEWPCSDEADMVARDVRLLERSGGHLHIAHVSCRETVSLIRLARDQGLHVTAEVTPHHLRLADTLLAGDERLGLTAAHPCLKVNPPLRSPEDIDALIEGLADGTIDAIATDHAPHSAADKSLPFASAAFGFTSLETALPLALDLVRSGRIGLCTLIELLTAGPAAVFNLPGGTLQPDSPADICVFDPNEEWTVSATALRSQGKNTPLLNATLRGRVRYTVCGGRVV